MHIYNMFYRLFKYIVNSIFPYDFFKLPCYNFTFLPLSLVFISPPSKLEPQFFPFPQSDHLYLYSFLYDSPNSPTLAMVPLYIHVSTVTAGYVLMSEDLELRASHEKEYVIIVSLDLVPSIYLQN